MYRLTLQCLPKDIPEGAEIATRYLADFDKTAMTFLAAYSAGSVVTWAEICRVGSKDFGARFFGDVSRSCHYTVSDHQHNAVAAQCLSFIATYVYRPSSVHISKLKTYPWLTRRRKCIPGRGVPRINAKLLTKITSYEIPNPSVQLLLSLGFALNYLPVLLDSASYSSEVVELAKCWWSRKYLRLLFPDETAKARKAINGYLRVSGNNGYISPLNFIFRSRY